MKIRTKAKAGDMPQNHNPVALPRPQKIRTAVKAGRRDIQPCI
jgi:hypothetical protein